MHGTTPTSLFRVVLVGVDGSDGARHALMWAAALAEATSAEVVAVHVLTYSRELLRDLGPDTVHTWRHDLEQRLEGEWTAPISGVPHRTRLIEADSPAAGLLSAAASEHVDLIVVGTKGHGNLPGRVLGGVSYRLAHRAQQPVVVVPTAWALVA